ncbi:hypothetical protein CJU90_3878 [Yarrowia sp. C11]|nr:hypothetical protein CKK34_5489 [Yarrowia sp. E02]KAG5367578.1 hypothetical protein CJU90_3878 [Yarrowia sp. C11]
MMSDPRVSGSPQVVGQSPQMGLGQMSPGNVNSMGMSPGQGPGQGTSPGHGHGPSPGQPGHGQSPGVPNDSPLAPSNTPGRLVKDDSGILHYSQSFFSSVLQSNTPVKSMEGEASGVPFFCKPGEPDPSIPPTQLPIPRHVITTLLTTYISDIHSVIRIVDLVQFHKDLTDYFAEPKTATPGKMAMLYAMLFFAADVYIKLNEGAQSQAPDMEHSGLGKLRGMELSGSKAGSGGSSDISTHAWVEWKNKLYTAATNTLVHIMFRRLYQRLVGCNPRDLSRDLALLDHVRGFHERLFETTSHCDSRSRRTAFCMSRLVNSRCLIYLYTPYLSRKEKPGDLASSSPDSRDSRDALREHIFTTSLLSLEYALEMTLSPYYVNQQWFSRKYTQVEHLLFLLTKLKLDPAWSQQKRAWQLACRTCEAYTKGYFADSSSKGWHACIKLRDIVSRTLGLEIDLGKEQWPLSVEYEGTRRKESSMGSFSAASSGSGSRESGLRSSLSFGVKVEESGASVAEEVGPSTTGPTNSNPTDVEDKKVTDSAFTAAMETANDPSHVSQPVTIESDMSFSLNPTDILDSNLFGAFPLAANSVRDDWTQELGGDVDWSEWDKMVHFIRGQ